MSTVTSLRGGELPAGQVNDHVVKMLEYYLDRAKKGEVIAVAVSAVCPNSFIEGGRTYPDGQRWSLNSAIDYTKAKFLAEIVEGTDVIKVP